MSWKPEVKVQGKWCHNSLVFATEREAGQSARDLFMRWTQCDEHRATQSDEPVTHTYSNPHGVAGCPVLTAIDPVSA